MIATPTGHPSAERDCAWPAPGLSVLVADRDAGRAEALARALEGAGHDVRVVYDGIDALTAALVEPPDVLLTAAGLPRLDGREVARRARAALGRSCLLVAVSDADPAADTVHSGDAADVYLAQPIAVRDLLAALDRYQPRPR